MPFDASFFEQIVKGFPEFCGFVFRDELQEVLGEWVIFELGVDARAIVVVTLGFERVKESVTHSVIKCLKIKYLH